MHLHTRDRNIQNFFFTPSSPNFENPKTRNHYQSRHPPTADSSVATYRRRKIATTLLPAAATNNRNTNRRYRAVLKEVLSRSSAVVNRFAASANSTYSVSSILSSIVSQRTVQNWNLQQKKK
ncbi:uncharacterized protein [Cicer arietinum]|uniref:uncharacterized protein n=1 Tax=Cicer arietinum TaxID=3827 RepID=UPI003CC5677E